MLRVILATLLSLPFCYCTAYAEKDDIPPEGLRGMASHVIVGTVKKIYTRTEQLHNWKTTYYVAEVHVDNVEKGKGLKSNELAYVRYWRRRWIGKGAPPPSTNGHRGLPSKSDNLRIYLARNRYDGFTKNNQDGGYNVIGANGFEALAKVPGK